MEVLPCPYCGSAAHVLGDREPWFDHEVNRTHETNVTCDNVDCMAQGPFLASDEQAAAAWNHVARIVAQDEERKSLLASIGTFLSTVPIDARDVAARGRIMAEIERITK